MTNINKKVIFNFYRNLRFKKFTSITLERKAELDTTVATWRAYFDNNPYDILALMDHTARIIALSSRTIGLQSGDEQAYFYVKMVDPELLLLEVYESANTTQEFDELCMKNFRTIDKPLLYLEKCYNAHFKEYTPDDLWSRDKIKR